VVGCPLSYRHSREKKKVQGQYALFNFAVIEPGTRDSLFTFNHLMANNAARELRIIFT
jgi:hypothetical protein